VLPHGQLTVLGAAFTASDGSTQQLLGRHQTKYREVYRDNLVAAYANADAFPRAFYVPSARVASSSQEAFSAMTQQPFDPARQVVLVPDEQTGPVTTSGDNDVRSNTSADDRPVPGTISKATLTETVVDVNAPAAGYLVLTDSAYPGWHASIDGAEQPIVRADLLFRAVPVPAGTHTVRFWFDPDSVRLGLAISALALIASLGLLASGRRGRRRPRLRSGSLVAGR
jgi:hypothetical protein